MSELSDELVKPALTLEETCDNVTSALTGDDRSDDVALLLARTHVLGPDLVASWDLPSDPAIVIRARKLGRAPALRVGPERTCLHNGTYCQRAGHQAIRCGAEPIRLRMILGDALVCEVFDASNSSPRLCHARTNDEGGRGLFLVAQTTHRWGFRYTTVGKAVWAERVIPERQP